MHSHFTWSSFLCFFLAFYISCVFRGEECIIKMWSGVCMLLAHVEQGACPRCLATLNNYSDLPRSAHFCHLFSLCSAHGAAAEFEMAKKCSKDFRTAMRTPSSRALKWAHTSYVWSSGPKPLNGQPLDRIWIRLAIKGCWTQTPPISSGGYFEALDAVVFMAVLKSFEHFFAISKLAAALRERYSHLLVKHRISKPGLPPSLKGVRCAFFASSSCYLVHRLPSTVPARSVWIDSLCAAKRATKLFFVQSDVAPSYTHHTYMATPARFWM